MEKLVFSIKEGLLRCVEIPGVKECRAYMND